MNDISKMQALMNQSQPKSDFEQLMGALEENQKLKAENAELKKVIDAQAARLYEQKTLREQKLWELYRDANSLGMKPEYSLNAAKAALAVWEAGAGEILNNKQGDE
jgi:regulator of replication initiation timing